MSMRFVIGMTCVQCHKRHPFGEHLMTCPDCGDEGVLDIELDVERARKALTRDVLQIRPLTHWRYLELLPIDEKAVLPSLQVGMTPLYASPRLAAVLGLKRLLLKDDGRNPTSSFKDRASSVGVVKACELGKRTIACASTGNAASSLAGFAAAAGLTSFIFVPARAPEPKLAQLLIFGANVLRVGGSYEQAYDLCQAACERYGWYNRNCAVNPYLVEGKKTVGLELAEQLGGAMPDWVVLSVGDGCTIAGAWKGLSEGYRLGWIPRLPRLLGVQAAGSAPIVEAWKSGTEQLQVIEPKTLADSISVGQPRNWRKALRAIRASQGAMVAVEDEAILEAMRQTARLAAVFAEPAAAAGVAGLARAVEQGIVGRNETALVVITGNGLKDVKSAIAATRPPIDIPADMKALDAALTGAKLI